MLCYIDHCIQNFKLFSYCLTQPNSLEGRWSIPRNMGIPTESVQFGVINNNLVLIIIVLLWSCPSITRWTPSSVLFKMLEALMQFQLESLPRLLSVRIGHSSQTHLMFIMSLILSKDSHGFLIAFFYVLTFYSMILFTGFQTKKYVNKWLIKKP